MSISHLINNLECWFRGISKDRYWTSFFCVLLLTIFGNGLGAEPSDLYRAISEYPFQELVPNNYQHESPLLPLIAYYTGLTSKFSFYALSLAIIIFSFILLAFISRKRMTSDLALLSICLILSHPVTIILLSWLGMPDGITFLFTILLLFTRSRLAMGLICFLAAFNHPLMVFAAPVIIMLRILSNEREVKPTHLFMALAGLILGTIAVKAFLTINDIHTVSRIDYMLCITAIGWVKHNASNFPLTIYSMHNTIWLALLVCIISVFSKNRVYFIAFVLSQLYLYGITFFALDSTRIFSLLAWACALHCIWYSIRLAEKSDGVALSNQIHQAILLISLIGLIIPDYYMWEGDIHPSNFSNFYFSMFRYLQSVF